MGKIKLIYFEGCPEAKNARAALISAGVSDFEVVEQDQLKEGHPFREYSSPTILKGEDIILGSKLSYGVSACSFQKIDPEEIKLKLNSSKRDFRQNNSKKGGLVGAAASAGSGLIVGFCPACIPALGAFLSSVGLGVVVQDSVLRPALILMLLFANGGFLWGYLKVHHIITPLVMGLLASGAMYVGRYVYINATTNEALIYGAIPLLLGAALWNLYLGHKAKRLKGCSKSS